MTEPVTLQTLLTYLTLISVPVGVFYHIMTLRNAQKARKMGTLMQLVQTRQSPEAIHRFWRIMGLDWENFDDYLGKYGIYAHPEVTEEIQLITSAWSFYDNLGMILKEGLIDLITVDEMLGSRIMMVWFKYESVIQGVRHLEGGWLSYKYLANFESLANEIIRLRKSKGERLPLDWLHSTSTLHQKPT